MESELECHLLDGQYTGSGLYNYMSETKCATLGVIVVLSTTVDAQCDTATDELC